MTKKKTTGTKAKKQERLILPEHLTIDTLSDQIKKFKTLLSKSNEIVIQSTGTIQTIDLAGIQALLFFKNYCLAKKVKSDFNLKIEDSIMDLFSKSGFPDLIKVLST